LCAVERYERIRFADYDDDVNPLRLQSSQWNDRRHELSHPFPPLPKQQLTGAEFRRLDHECRPDHALSWNTFRRLEATKRAGKMPIIVAGR
jgi:hypothetical protein